MSSDIFGSYDYENVPLSQPVAEVAPKQGSTPSFDFGDYDTSPFESNDQYDSSPSVGSQSSPYFGQYSAYTPEQYQALSPEMKQTLQNYSPLEGFAKGALSTATLGLSESPNSYNAISYGALGGTGSLDKLPDMSVQPYMSGSGAGGSVGMLAPIAPIVKGVQVGGKAITKAIPALGRAAEAYPAVARTAGAAATGATYGAAKQTGNIAEGKEFNIGEIPYDAMIFSLMHGTGEVGLKAFRWFKGLSPTEKTQLLQEKILPSNLPESDREYARIIADRINHIEPQASLPGGGPQQIPSAQGPIQGKVTKGGQPIAAKPQAALLSPKQQLTQESEQLVHSPKKMMETVGKIFSEELPNSVNAGKQLMGQVRKQSEALYGRANKAYDYVEEANTGLSDINTSLINDAQNIVEELSALEPRTPAQQKLLSASKNIIKKGATIDKEGNITGYLPIENNFLLKEMRVLRKEIDYDFRYGNEGNIVKPLINKMSNAVESAAVNAGRPEAVQASKAANKLYAEWADTYASKYTTPYRRASNKDYKKGWSSALSTDNANVLIPILRTTPEGNVIANQIERAIVERKLGKNFYDPSKDALALESTFKELEGVIPPDKLNQARQQFVQASEQQAKSVKLAKEAERAPISTSSLKGKRITNDTKRIAKVTKRKVDEVQNLTNSPDGNEELLQFAKDHPELADNVGRMQDIKLRDIMYEGKISGNPTGKKLGELWNTKKNFDILSSIRGLEEAREIRQAALELGDNVITIDNINKLLKLGKIAYRGAKGVSLLMSLL